MLCPICPLMPNHYLPQMLYSISFENLVTDLIVVLQCWIEMSQQLFLSAAIICLSRQGVGPNEKTINWNKQSIEIQQLKLATIFWQWMKRRVFPCHIFIIFTFFLATPWYSSFFTRIIAQSEMLTDFYWGGILYHTRVLSLQINIHLFFIPIGANK